MPISPQSMNAANSQRGFNVFSLLTDGQSEPSVAAKIPGVSALETEWDAYCKSRDIPDMRVDVLKWWQASAQCFYIILLCFS